MRPYACLPPEDTPPIPTFGPSIGWPIFFSRLRWTRRSSRCLLWLNVLSVSNDCILTVPTRQRTGDVDGEPMAHRSTKRTHPTGSSKIRGPVGSPTARQRSKRRPTLCVTPKTLAMIYADLQSEWMTWRDLRYQQWPRPIKVIQTCKPKNKV